MSVSDRGILSFHPFSILCLLILCQSTILDIGSGGEIYLPTLILCRSLTDSSRAKHSDLFLANYIEPLLITERSPRACLTDTDTDSLTENKPSI
ncbi:hypothetical protein BDV18DRAFT_130281, partial [Aspergillus unguis]